MSGVGSIDSPCFFFTEYKVRLGVCCGSISGSGGRINSEFEKNGSLITELIQHPWLPEQLPGWSGYWDHFLQPQHILSGFEKIDLNWMDKPSCQIVLISWEGIGNMVQGSQYIDDM